MKPIIPAVPLTIWKELYETAIEFNAAKPWDILDDLDLVGVLDPTTGERGYSVVMGSGGTLFGLAVYRGDAGYECYRRAMTGEREASGDDGAFAHDSLIAVFCSKQELEKPDNTVLKELNLKFKGARSWPQFRSYLPRYAPWFLTEAEARFLTVALRAMMLHAARIDNLELAESVEDERCLFYLPKEDDPKKFREEWYSLPEKSTAPLSPPILNLEKIHAIRSKRLSGSAPWEVEVVCLPSTISDRERPYFARNAVVVDAESGMVIDFHLAMPEAETVQVYADAVSGAVAKTGVLPRAVLVKYQPIGDALQPLAKTIGTMIRIEKKLPQASMVLKAMEKSMRKGRF